MDLSGRLERIYEVLHWPEDLGSPRGRERFEGAYRVFKEVVRHDWLKELVEGRTCVRVLDVCGGTGVGGLALAKALKELGVEVALTVNDLRSSALEKARRYGKELLGLEVETLLANALVLHEVGVRADMALLYGFSTPHFSPYDMVKLVSSLAKVLEPRGVLLIEEADRTRTLLLMNNYRHVLTEYVGEGKVVMTLHAGYDPLKGVIKRVAIELPTMKVVEMDVRFWDIASTASILWIFFSDVDFISTDGAGRGVLIAKEPRGVDPKGFSEYPRVLRSTT